jgi:hypothetical protein
MAVCPSWLGRRLCCRLPFVYNKITNCTEQSPSQEADRSSATQNNCCILWNPKFHYRFHNSLPLVPFWAILIQSTLWHLISLRCILILFHLRIVFPNDLFSWGLPTKILRVFYTHACHVSDLSHMSWLDPCNDNQWRIFSFCCVAAPSTLGLFCTQLGSIGLQPFKNPCLRCPLSAKISHLSSDAHQFWGPPLHCESYIHQLLYRSGRKIN